MNDYKCADCGVMMRVDDWALKRGVPMTCGRCIPNLRTALAESEARRAEAEGRVAGHLAARLAMREEADRSRAERDDMSAERDAALRRAEAAERRLTRVIAIAEDYGPHDGLERIIKAAKVKA